MGRVVATGRSGKQGLKSNHVRAGGRAAGNSAPRHDSAPAGVRVGWREAIAATVTGLGFELVDIERAQRGLLRVFIDRIPGRAYALAGEFVTVEDCEQVTRQLQYVLEVEALTTAGSRSPRRGWTARCVARPTSSVLPGRP